MPLHLVPGPYESLLDRRLEAEVAAARAQDRWIDAPPADADLRAELLARQVYALTRRALADVPSGSGQALAQVEVNNRLLAALRSLSPGGTVLEHDALDPEARLLREARPLGPGLGERSATPRPHLSLAASGLLVNGRRDYQFGAELAREIVSADRIDLLSAFVRFAGLRLVREALADFVQRGGQLRVITTVYTGSAEKRALDELVKLGAQVKASYETAQTRLHAKAWLFEWNTGLHTAYIGSSNLTHSALVEELDQSAKLAAG